MSKREFWCDTCSMKEPLYVAALKAHMASVHRLDGKITGSRKCVASIDGGNFYQNTYEWRFPGDVRVTEVRSGTSN